MKKAFTLAEVLITLGIIGIVAAMTMPMLIAKHQKKVSATRLAQTYSQLSQAVLLAQKDHEDIKYWDFGGGGSMAGDNYKNVATKFVNTYIKPYLKINQDLGYITLDEFGYKDGIKAMNGKQAEALVPNNPRYILRLVNGVTLFMRNDNDGTNISNNLLIYVDINGDTKPNVTGRDIFLMKITPSQGLQMFGSEKTREDLLQNQCTTNTEWGNIMCGAVIQKDGWEIKDDYPW